MKTPAAVEPMIVPVAVYTAHLGCAWTHLPDFVSEVEARNGRKAVASVLRSHNIELQSGDIVKGVLYEGKYAVAFGWQKVESWDQAGRDADYYACAFIPPGMIGKVDFGGLLQHEFFVRPNTSPPDRIDCSGLKCDLVSYERTQELLSAIREDRCAEPDWGACGPMLSREGASALRLLVVSVKTANGTSCYSKCASSNDLHAPLAGEAKCLADDARTEGPHASERLECERLKIECKRLRVECDQLRAECGETHAECDRLRTDNDVRAMKLAKTENALLKLQGSLQKLEQGKSASENDVLFKITLVGVLAFALGFFMKMGIEWLCR